MQIELPPIIEIGVESDYPEPGNYRKRVVQPKITWGTE